MSKVIVVDGEVVICAASSVVLFDDCGVVDPEDCDGDGLPVGGQRCLYLNSSMQVVQVEQLPDPWVAGAYLYIDGQLIVDEGSLAWSLHVAAIDKAKKELCDRIDARIAEIYNRWLRFDAEYTAREAAARAFVDAGCSGEPTVWVGAFAASAGLSSQIAAERIIAQAEGLRTALEQLGALRMEKYRVLAAATEAAAQVEFNNILVRVDQIAEVL